MSSPSASLVILEERVTSTRTCSARKSKNNYALEKLKKKRARRALPASQRRKENDKSDDSEIDNDEVDGGELHVHASDEDFIDDDSYGEISNSEEEDVQENNKWKQSLQNVIKMFRNPADNNESCSTNQQTSKKYKHLDDTNSDESDRETLLNLSENEQRFCDCVMSNDVENLKSIPNFKTYFNLTLNNSKHTALHIASMKGHLEMIKMLITNDADTTVTDQMHFIPLTYAVLHKFPDCFKYLLHKTNLSILPRLHKYWKSSNLLHFLVTTGDTTQVTNELEKRILQCVHIFKEFNKKIFSRYLQELDCTHSTPLLLALANDLPMVIIL